MSGPTLEPCPFCGAGTTRLRPNGQMWNGQGMSDPVSVSVEHWCEPVPGQPGRMIERVGRDAAAAAEAWNRRAALAALVQAEPVAVVSDSFRLHWAGSEPLAALLARHPGIRVGSPLYASPQAPQAVPAGWQPIETAPRDEFVLIACSHGQYVAEFCSRDIEWWHVDDNKHDQYPLRGSGPTHWMPLPAPPVAARPQPEQPTPKEPT